jgi:hypothetical protein
VKSMYISRIALLASGAIALIAANAGIASGQPPATEKIAMHALNGSWQNGSSTITDHGGTVLVSVRINGESSSASEPAHIHFGHCPIIKAVPAYNVGPIVKGKATSVVNLTWAEINSGKYVVMVHKSPMAMGTYVSCGNIGTSHSP